MDTQNRDFWNKQAFTFKDATEAVNFDPLQEVLEHDCITKLLSNGKTICDLGCGNGRNIFEQITHFPDSIFVGLDFSEEMINVAEEKRIKWCLPNASFACRSASDEFPLKGLPFTHFDIVVAKRLLINIKDDIERKKILNNIWKMLKPGGVYIMIECFIEPLNKINNIRKMIGLSEIAVKDFNRYLDQPFIQNIEGFKVETVVDFASLYYFNSRIINGYFSIGTPSYTAPINKLSMELTLNGVQPMSGYSPQKCIVLEKI